MTVAAGLMVIIARRLTGSGWAGLFAGLIMALDPVISYYAQTARSYAMVFCCVLGRHAGPRACAGSRGPSRAGDALAAAGSARWLVYAALITVGGYLNEMSLLVLAAHAVTVLLARYGRPTVRHWFVGAGGRRDPGPAARRAEHQGFGRHRGHPAGPARYAGPFPRLLRRDDRWPSAAGHCAVFAVLPAAALPAIRSRGRDRPPGRRPLPRGGRAAASRCRRWRRRFWCCRPCPAGRGVAGAARRCTPTGTSCTARRARPCWPGRVCTGSAMGRAVARPGWPDGASRAAPQAGARWCGCRACSCACARWCCSSGRSSGLRTPLSRQYDFGGPALLRRRARPAGRRRAVLQHVLPEGQARLPGATSGTSPTSRRPCRRCRAGTSNGIDKPVAQVRSLMLRYRRIWVVGALPVGAGGRACDQGRERTAAEPLHPGRQRQFKGMEVTLWQRR